MQVFESTIWETIEQARRGNEEAMNQLLTAYRVPIQEFIRSRGFPADDAEDLTQEVFTRIVSRGLLRKAERCSGKFRSLLIGITRNVIGDHLRTVNAAKRGGDTRRISLESAECPDQAAPEESDAFDRLWVFNLLHRAMNALKAEAQFRGSLQHEVVRLALIQGAGLDAICEELALTKPAVRNLLHRGRRSLLSKVRLEISRYTKSGIEREKEFQFVLSFLGK